MVHLKMILRSWKRSIMSTAISATSLIIGLVCSITLILFVLGEYRIKDALGNTNDVYLIERYNPFYNDNSSITDDSNPKTTLKISEMFGEVESIAIAKKANWRHKEAINKTRWEMGVYEVTPDFCKIFKIPVKEGNLERTLNSPSEIAVTNNYMQYIYGKNAVIGDRIIAETGGNAWINGVQQAAIPHDVTITTILDDNTKTPLAYGALTLMPLTEISSMSDAYYNSYYSFIKLRENTNVQEMATKIAADTLNFRNNNKLFFTPFSKVYLDDSQRGNSSYGTQFIIRRDPSLLIIGLTIAIAILVIAMFNYINITMTRARNRLRNIAGQRIFGASKWNVRWQTVLDTSLLVTISFIISLVIIHYITNTFNNFMDCKIAVGDLLYPQNAAVVVGVLLLLIAGSSIYILVKIEVSSPMEILKNQVGNKISISNVMVIAQFVISIVLIAVSLNISRQINFIATQLPVANSILQIRNNMQEKLPKDFTDAIKNLSIVDHYTANGPIPGGKISSGGVSTNELTANQSIFDFYEIELLEGRHFDENDNRGNIIVNEASLPVFKIESPAVGKQICFNRDTSTIIGVVKNFTFDNAHNAIQPLFIRKDEGDQSNIQYWEIYLKVNGEPDKAINKINDVWNSTYPNTAGINIKTVAQIYKEMHPTEIRLMEIVNIFMYISTILTALGLFGLAFYTVEKRAKEIAIRKIHGSTTASVILLLCRTFATWIGVAIVIAVPISVYFSIEWLASFAYRVPLVAWVFVITIVIAAIVTFITVIFQTWKAASANPVDMKFNGC